MPGEHRELDALREPFLERDDGDPIVIEVAAPLHPASQRLMDFFGVEVRIVSAPARTRDVNDVQRRGVAAVAFRASRANVYRRLERGETPAVCEECGCETDVATPAHSPTCSQGGVAPEPTLESLDPPAVLEEPPYVIAPPDSSNEHLASVVRAKQRAAADDFTLEICGYCGCEVDVDEPAHRPGCQGIGKPRVSDEAVLPGLSAPPARADRAKEARDEKVVTSPSSREAHSPASPGRDLDDGLDALARMDAGLPQQPRAPKDSFDEGAVDLDQEEGPRSPTPGSGESDEEQPPMRAPTADATDAAGEAQLEPGAPPNRESRTWSRRKKTPDEVLAAIRDVAAIVGHAPSRRDMRTHGRVSAQAAAKAFGSWPAALAACGYQARGSDDKRVWTRDTAIAKLQEVAEQLGRPPMSSDHGLGLPGTHSFRQLFGSWANFMEAAGFARPTRGGKRAAAAALPEREPTASDPGSDFLAPDPPAAIGRVAEVAAAGVGPEPPSRSESADAVAAPPGLEEVRERTLNAVNALFDLLEATERALGARS